MLRFFSANSLQLPNNRAKLQYGHVAVFIKSCVTQLLEYLEDITEAMDNGKDVDVIYLDFCKAFDKIPHRRLAQEIRRKMNRRDRVY